MFYKSTIKTFYFISEVAMIYLPRRIQNFQTRRPEIDQLIAAIADYYFEA